MKKYIIKFVFIALRMDQISMRLYLHTKYLVNLYN